MRLLKTLGILGETRLRVSLPARGMYTELIGLSLRQNGGAIGRMPLDVSGIACLADVTEETAQSLLTELKAAGLIELERMAAGYLISIPALLRAQEISAKRAAAGRRGGNPVLLKAKAVLEAAA